MPDEEVAVLEPAQETETTSTAATQETPANKTVEVKTTAKERMVAKLDALDNPEKAKKEATEKTSETRSTQTEATKTAATDKPEAEKKTDAPNSEAPKKPEMSRFTKEMQEVKERARKAEEKAAALEARLNSQPAPKAEEQPQEPKAIVQPPEKPKYTREQLAQFKAGYRQAYDQANAIGDEAKAKESADFFNECERQERLVDKYDIDHKFWKIENGQAHEKLMSQFGQYDSRIAKEMPELRQSGTPLNEKLMEIARDPENADLIKWVKDRPDADYLIGKFANDRLKASQLDASVKENEELKKEIASLKGKLNPVDGSDGAESTDSPGEKKETPKQKMKRRLREEKIA